MIDANNHSVIVIVKFMIVWTVHCCSLICNVASFLPIYFRCLIRESYQKSKGLTDKIIELTVYNSLINLLFVEFDDFK